MSTKTETVDPATPIDPENMMKTFAEIQAKGFGSMSWLGTAWLENASDIGSEWLRFVSDRVAEDVKTQHLILHAKSVAEVQEIQSQFLRKAVADYQDETGKMVDLCTKMMARLEEKAAEKP